MPTPFTLSLSPNFKWTYAAHRGWGVGVVGNGESWPRVIGSQIITSADIYNLGIVPAFTLAAVTTAASGTSNAATYGIVQVYRSTKFNDGLTLENIQSNRSNIQDVTLSSSQAAVLTKVVSTDTKVDKIDIYAAESIGGVYGAFYRVVKGCANAAGTVTFNIVLANTFPVGGATSEGTVDTSNKLLATDNDYPAAQPLLFEVAGRLVSCGGINKRVAVDLTNGSGTVTTTETVYDGILQWYFKRDTDTTGGVDGRGTYLANYAGVNSVSLVDATGVATTYTGTTGAGTASIWPAPNRRYSKLLNPHSFPLDNINNDYPSGILAGGKVPNSNRLLLMGNNWVIAEDYDRLPMTDGLNYISTEYGCASPFSVVSAHGRVYWLDLGKGKREIIVSDGSTAIPISTAKIKSILARVTLDSNGDVWRVGFIAGVYIRESDTIRWGLYLDNNTTANFILELDLNTGDVRSDPQYYGHRYLDVFTYGVLRGRPYVGQYGWSGGIARIGLDNVPLRYRDWVASGDLMGTIDAAGNSTSTVNCTTVAAAFDTTSTNTLKGIQCLIWRETDAAGDLIVNPTYYHCRIASNTATAVTVNYVETMNTSGAVSAVGTELPSAPSGAGWKISVGVIQAIIGPKWFGPSDGDSVMTFRQLTMNHQGQDVTTYPVRFQGFENFDKQPRDGQYMEPVQQGDQVASASISASSFAIPKTNPSSILGFALVDNNSNTATTALNIETITLDWNEQPVQDDISKQ